MGFRCYTATATSRYSHGSHHSRNRESQSNCPWQEPCSSPAPRWSRRPHRAGSAGDSTGDRSGRVRVSCWRSCSRCCTRPSSSSASPGRAASSPPARTWRSSPSFSPGARRCCSTATARSSPTSLRRSARSCRCRPSPRWYRRRFSPSRTSASTSMEGWIGSGSAARCSPICGPAGSLKGSARSACSWRGTSSRKASRARSRRRAASSSRSGWPSKSRGATRRRRSSSSTSTTSTSATAPRGSRRRRASTSAARPRS